MLEFICHRSRPMAMALLGATLYRRAITLKVTAKALLTVTLVTLSPVSLTD
jgi:hypothetical protein